MSDGTSPTLLTARALHHVCALLGIDDDAAEGELLRIASLRRLDKGEVLCPQGQVPAVVAFALEGILRTCYTDAAGREVTDCIIDRASLPIVTTPDLRAPAIETVEALTPCVLLCLDAEGVEGLCARSLPVSRACNAILGAAWQMHWDMRTVTSKMCARERYEWFLREHPGVIDQVPHHVVASFLCMTPVTLSRVRAQLRDEQGSS